MLVNGEYESIEDLLDSKKNPDFREMFDKELERESEKVNIDISHITSSFDKFQEERSSELLP